MPRSRKTERDRRRSPTAGRHADSIRLALMEVAPAGLKKPRLMAVTELSGSQLVRGLAASRELAGEKGWPPLVWSSERGYYFCLEADALEAWEQQWADVKFIQISRGHHRCPGSARQALSQEPLGELRRRPDEGGPERPGHDRPPSGPVTEAAERATMKKNQGPAPAHRPHPGTGPSSLSTRASRYPSDTTDAEWALIEPLLPTPACQTERGGHPDKWPRREIVDGIRYLVDNGIKWRAMPSDYPPWRTIYGFARRWAAAGGIGVIRDQLCRRIRLAAGKTPNTASVIVDSQSIKASEAVSKATRGWDGGKLINGRKRHLICDHRSLMLLVMVTPADAQDSLVARELLLRLAFLHPEIAIVWADSAYAKNQLIPWAKKYLDITVKTVRRPPDTKGFIVLPRRWAVERSWSWIMRARRHCRDHERLPEVSESLITWAAVTLMTRRLTRHRSRPAERRDAVHGYGMPEAA